MPSDPKDVRAIKQAVKSGDVKTVRSLLEEQPDLAVAGGHGWTPLQDAAFNGKKEILRIMLSAVTAIPAADIAHALHHAVQLPRADPDVVEMLLATGKVAEPFAALYRGNVEVVASSLQANRRLAHATDAEGCPVLLRAAENAQEEMVRLLLTHGADIEARGPRGKSALSACSCNQVDRKKRARTLRLLLESGADVNGRTFAGQTPLFSAATAGWGPEDSVKILLQHGADPNVRDHRGRTVLQEVLLRPSARAQRVAALLRKAGADESPMTS